MAAVIDAEIVPLHPPVDLTVHRNLTKDEALELTAEIRASANRLWMLVSIAHDRKAWRALGYQTWKDYVTTELGISESRSYQLIDTGRVMLAIVEATGTDPTELDPVPARTVAKVKEHLPALRKAIAGFLEANPSEDPAGVIEAALAEIIPAAVRGEAPAKRTARQPVICPACQGGGDLGTGKHAVEFGDALGKWMKRWFARR